MKILYERLWKTLSHCFPFDARRRGHKRQKDLRARGCIMRIRNMQVFIMYTNRTSRTRSRPVWTAPLFVWYTFRRQSVPRRDSAKHGAVGEGQGIAVAVDRAVIGQTLISLLCTIPGVDRNSAITIISEIGTDMAQFGSSKRLCCWAGLTPGNNESAGKKKSVRITRAGVYLKPALVQAAHAAVKATDNSYYRLKYEQIAKRRGKKRAIIAIARMILTAVFKMMSTGEVWTPADLFKVDMPETLKEKQLAKAVKQATKFLEKQGLTVAS